ncbi:Outer membrane protein OprM precursor [Pirellulimonas nuda]|uniref:Outer membrane protein OprM n=1 Tax=Pirellulimonas nuda TaxID=2528009 RepID=A0A518DE40_9BACT|nr:efflux transporter outer membrane subunit [Pirellulimonas nuda]QDU89737.1 Outer membrane protein OprM precursor [Pirellulimonas nuda]
MSFQNPLSDRLGAGPWRRGVCGVCLAIALAAAGCTGPREWIANGFKVGPNYCPPGVAVSENWIDADDKRILDQPADLVAWWAQFEDPVLNELVATAYDQNLTLREAGARILEARMLRQVAVGNLFPQTQTMSGEYSRNKSPGDGPGTYFSNWNGSFAFAWELDFWGRYRRAVAVADADLDASVFDYGDVVVTLIADVAATYVDIRTQQTQLALVRENVANQRETYELTERRFLAGDANDVDVQQAKSSLAQTESLVPQLEISVRLSQNQLCLLLGMPIEDILPLLGEGEIPEVSTEIAVGIPAVVLLRRPDVRRAERNLAAQSELIGIAASELYPHISITGNAGVTAARLGDLFTPEASFASIGPSFRWNILNYGRITGNIGVQEARFQQLLASYRQTVLVANFEAENAIKQFLGLQEVLKFRLQAAEAADRTNELINNLLEEGDADINRVFTVQNFKTQQEVAAALAKGQVAQSTISIYRALGGGWPSPYLGQADIGPVRPAETPETVEAPAEELPSPEAPLAQPDALSALD